MANTLITQTCSYHPSIQTHPFDSYHVNQLCHNKVWIDSPLDQVIQSPDFLVENTYRPENLATNKEALLFPPTPPSPHSTPSTARIEALQERKRVSLFTSASI
jgi:hypothetical protein